MLKIKSIFLSKIEFLARIFFITLIYIYRGGLKPLLFGGPCCRFTPSCSEYALQSFKKHTFFKALKMTCVRLLKCNPFGPFGFDPVPQRIEEKP